MIIYSLALDYCMDYLFLFWGFVGFFDSVLSKFTKLRQPKKFL